MSSFNLGRLGRASASAIAPGFSALFLVKENFSRFGVPLARDCVIVLTPSIPRPALLIRNTLRHTA